MLLVPLAIEMRCRGSVSQTHSLFIHETDDKSKAQSIRDQNVNQYLHSNTEVGSLHDGMNHAYL